MLELIPSDESTYTKGNYIIEILPDGVNIRLALKKEPVNPEMLINMADWLTELAFDLGKAP